MWALTLIYMVFTLLNLGTLSFPTSVWTAQSGAAVRIDLGAEYDVVEIWTNGNIAEGSAVFTRRRRLHGGVYAEIRDHVYLAHADRRHAHAVYNTAMHGGKGLSQRDCLLRCRRQSASPL